MKRAEIAATLYVKARTDAERLEAAELLMELGTESDTFDTLERERVRAEQVEVLEAVVAFIRRFVVMPEPAAVLCGLWTLHAHAIEAADVTPYLIVTSPEKRSGKSRLLEVLKLIVPGPFHAVLPSEAVLFRTISAGGCTLLMDEADAFFHANAGPAQEAVRAVLNAGFERGAIVPRCSDKGKSIEHFEVFCPKVVSGIGDPPDTILDRGFRIAMRRRKPKEQRVRFRRRDVRPEGEALRDRCAAFAAAHIETLRAARPEIPDSLNDRAADAAEPLLAIADVIGGAWPMKARAALLDLAGESDAESDTLGGRLLADLRRVLDLLQNPERVRTSDLLRELHAVEDGPWKRYGYRREPLEADDLARLLKPYGIRPMQLRVGADKVRGYRTADFADALARYGAGDEPEESELDLTHPPVQPGTPVQAAPGAANSVPPPPVQTPVQPGTAVARAASRASSDE